MLQRASRTEGPCASGVSSVLLCALCGNWFCLPRSQRSRAMSAIPAIPIALCASCLHKFIPQPARQSLVILTDHERASRASGSGRTPISLPSKNCFREFARRPVRCDVGDHPINRALLWLLAFPSALLCVLCGKSFWFSRSPDHPISRDHPIPHAPFLWLNADY